jgi:hypothetical protein
MIYDAYNREERALCAHLFRLLHEGLATDSESAPLRAVVRLLASRGVAISEGSLDDRRSSDATPAILTEVALIRDAYFARKPNVSAFMDALVDLAAKQESVSERRLYSELPEVLRDHRQTHPKQIATKARERGIELSDGERRVYEAVQAMFNAKPDLVIVLGDAFVVFEAKFTEAFDAEQLKRTEAIAQVWAELLYADLGFQAPPPYAVAKLGDAGAEVHLSWQDVLAIARETYGPQDRSRIAFEHAVALLEN